MSNFVGQRTLGVKNPSSVTPSTTQDEGVTLGEFVVTDTGDVYVYVLADGVIAQYAPVEVDGSYDCAASGNAGVAFGIAPQAFADNEYGWVQVRGVCTAQLAGSTADNALLSLVCDSNGDLVTVAAPNEGGTATHASGTLTVRARALSAESGGTGTVYLF